MSSHSERVKIFIKGNTEYNVFTKQLYIYNGLVTTPVVRKMMLGNYQVSKTQSGSIYVTVPPTSILLKSDVSKDRCN